MRLVKILDVKGFGEQHKSKQKKNNRNKISNEHIINKAINFHIQGNISEALKHYQYCINQGFNDHRVFSNYGVILQSIGKLKDAELSYRKAIELKPHYAEAHSNLGIILKDLGKLKDAELSYRKAIELKPHYAEAHSNLGIILKDLGKLKDAELSCRKAITIRSDFSEAHFNLGNILKSLDKLQDAELSYRKAIELKPHYAEAHFNLGNILKSLDKLQDAELSYRKAIELKPHYAKAYYNLGNILADLGKLQEAEISTRKLTELNPDSADAHSDLGNILKDLGKLQEAEVSTRKAIKLNPDLANAHCILGFILSELDKPQEAEVSTRKAIELNPNLAIAHCNLGEILINLGNLQEAEVSTRKAIELNPDLANAHCILGYILSDLGKLQEAKVSTLKAIELNPDLAIAHCNLGNVLKNLGNLQEAEISTLKAIELNTDLALAYYSLSTLKESNKNNIWRDKLFSTNLLKNKSRKDKINIYFAKANILHKESNFKESQKNLELANNLKQNLNPSNIKYLLNKTKQLFSESNNEVVDKKEYLNYPESIFIVGMPRSGSTLLESILSINNVDDLGEKNILEESFLNWKTTTKNLTLAELYLDQINIYSSELKTTTNKYLYNYQYAGIIARLLPNAKIIHCYRNPLDNILSIYRANFARGNEYSSSLVDCAKVYLDQEEIMTQYKKRFKSKIYNLDYDLLVSNPAQEINSLISWLGWRWDDRYLSPHLNPRSVSTASAVQVRSPINSKSIGGWKNYKEMLKPAMEIITKKDKYKNLKY